MHDPTHLNLMLFPYTLLKPIPADRRHLRSASRLPGSALVWKLSTPVDERLVDLVSRRPGGLPLLALLPHEVEIDANPSVLYRLRMCRPSSILPGSTPPSLEDLRQVLRRPPLDLAADVTDYLNWRGIAIDPATRQLLRKIIDLSTEVRSVSALARKLYTSRRALGRRLLKRGLPAPSHWLQVARILRASIVLQNSSASVFSVACFHEYPDGFSLSNQMYRLTGLRPSEARKYLGWEWIMERWLRMEAERGGLTNPTNASKAQVPQPTASMPERRQSTRRQQA